MVSKEEMLGWIDERMEDYMRPIKLSGHDEPDWHTKGRLVIDAIRSLIESAPEVMREWVAQNIVGFVIAMSSHGWLEHETTISSVCECLCAAGVRIKP